EMCRSEVEYLSNKLPDGGNLLEIRGLAGVFFDDEISAGIHEGVKQFPQFKIVGSVHGDVGQARQDTGNSLLRHVLRPVAV
ncbi:hypothetical protein ACC703_39425, partial [Rhizobium ruizarguesonis]